MSRKEPAHWKEVWAVLESHQASSEANVDKYGSHALSNTRETPEGRFRFLVGTLLSARTTDPITARGVQRLDTYLPASSLAEMKRKLAKSGELVDPMAETGHNLTVENVIATPDEVLAALIKPVGFYNQKAKNLSKIAEVCRDKYGGDIPRSAPELIKLPGIGHKIGNLIMSVAWGEAPGIAVDTHVCRISQRLGWAGTLRCSAEPNRVMRDLEEWLPKDRWGPVNLLLVHYGQTVCSATAPKCGDCAIGKEGMCPWVLAQGGAGDGSGTDSSDDSGEEIGGESGGESGDVSSEAS